MVKVGKQTINAPGYTHVANERKKWKELKQHHLTYPWFTKELDEWINKYKESVRNESWKDRYKRVWCNKTKKGIYVKLTHDEWLYWQLIFLGNGQNDKYYDGPIMFPSWSYESCLVFEEIMLERNKVFVYEVYKEKKELDDMENEDKRPKRSVRFEE
tara:strand:- start:4025 stop:4495 length:471 start_codon:yes stop_codon:yes gene_type:complete